MREVTCPSGAILKVSASPFADSKRLYQALLKELKLIGITSKTEMASIYKDIFCSGFSSPEVEKTLDVCMKRCTYNSGNGEFKIDENTFEPELARGDYIFVCMEVAKENVLPFVKSLYAEYLAMSETIENIQA